MILITNSCVLFTLLIYFTDFVSGLSRLSNKGDGGNVRGSRINPLLL